MNLEDKLDELKIMLKSLAIENSRLSREIDDIKVKLLPKIEPSGCLCSIRESCQICSSDGSKEKLNVDCSLPFSKIKINYE